MKKRIAFVTNAMTVGGVERALIALLDQIDYEKYDVVLWTKAAEEPLNLKLILMLKFAHGTREIPGKI